MFRAECEAAGAGLGLFRKYSSDSQKFFPNWIAPRRGTPSNQSAIIFENCYETSSSSTACEFLKGSEKKS